MDHYRIAVGMKSPNKKFNVSKQRSAGLPQNSMSLALSRRMASAPANFRYLYVTNSSDTLVVYIIKGLINEKKVGTN